MNTNSIAHLLSIKSAFILGALMAFIIPAMIPRIIYSFLVWIFVIYAVCVISFNLRRVLGVNPGTPTWNIWLGDLLSIPVFAIFVIYIFEYGVLGIGGPFYLLFTI